MLLQFRGANHPLTQSILLLHRPHAISHNVLAIPPPLKFPHPSTTLSFHASAPDSHCHPLPLLSGLSTFTLVLRTNTFAEFPIIFIPDLKDDVQGPA
jgi:hypothetical protein